MKPVQKASGGGAGPRKAKRAACPICGGQSEPAFRPFCSRRCADIDLGRWLSERYVIEGVSLASEGSAEDD